MKSKYPYQHMFGIFLCWSDFESNVVQSFYIFWLLPTDSGLLPYTAYGYSVVAVDSAGGTASVVANATTRQDIPQGQPPPTYKILPDQLDTIYLAWNPPTQPNGKLYIYI